MRTAMCTVGAIAFTFLMACAADSQVVNVWPGTAPGSENWTQKERAADNTPIHVKEFSMANIPIGTIVATRDLEFIREDGSVEDVTIEIGMPIRDPSPDAKGDWCCPWRVRGDVQDSSRAFFGVDSLQALTLQFLPVELDVWHRDVSRDERRRLARLQLDYAC